MAIVTAEMLVNWHKREAKLHAPQGLSYKQYAFHNDAARVIAELVKECAAANREAERLGDKYDRLTLEVKKLTEDRGKAKVEP